MSIIAKDPLNASVSTGFGIEAILGGSNIVNGANPAQIAGGVIGGGVFGLAALVGGIFGLWRYTADKKSRSTEQFADLIRGALDLKGVNNFDTEAGQHYVAVIHKLESALKAAGVDTQTMRMLERQQLAQDVAEVARNEISPATDCFGRSRVTVADLNDHLQTLVNEVQLLRAGGQKNRV